MQASHIGYSQLSHPWTYAYTISSKFSTIWASIPQMQILRTSPSHTLHPDDFFKATKLPLSSYPPTLCIFIHVFETNKLLFSKSNTQWNKYWNEKIQNLWLRTFLLTNHQTFTKKLTQVMSQNQPHYSSKVKKLLSLQKNPSSSYALPPQPLLLKISHQSILIESTIIKKTIKDICKQDWKYWAGIYPDLKNTRNRLVCLSHSRNRDDNRVDSQ
jgi:hypothetical protein